MKTLKDKVIIITGAGGSIAGEIEMALRKEGARVVLVDREIIRIQGRAASLGTLPIESDLNSLEDAKSVVSTIKSHTSVIDGLIHLVGDVVTGSVLELPEEAYQQVFDTNVKTLFNITKALLPELQKRDEGFIAGIASHEAWGGGAANASLFSAAKSAVAAFLHSLNAELRGTDIGVSIVYPMGPLDTLHNRKRYSETKTPLIHPKAIAGLLVHAALAGENGCLLELPIYPPHH